MTEAAFLFSIFHCRSFQQVKKGQNEQLHKHVINTVKITPQKSSINRAKVTPLGSTSCGCFCWHQANLVKLLQSTH